LSSSLPLTGIDLLVGPILAGAAGKKGWGIFYNSAIASNGRINFTLGHEFGHYLMRGINGQRTDTLSGHEIRGRSLQCQCTCCSRRSICSSAASTARRCPPRISAGVSGPPLALAAAAMTRATTK
jgi:hypothetical protein